jgi:diguanylate cyclase (GGDEF)-like protein
LRLFLRPFEDFGEVRVFLISLSLIIALFISVIFLGVYLRGNTLLLETVRDEARSYFGLIVQTRLWNAKYGGVYVEKQGDIQSNQFLKDVGVEPDIKCEDNRVFTMRNPALMTKEISQLTSAENGVKFHITSLKPINPQNTPDLFEEESLKKFERGIKEVWKLDRTTTSPLFRYMAPLYVDESCLVCHRGQGYKVGGVRGGISVNIPLGELDLKMKTNKVIITVLLIITIVILLLILYFMVWKLVSRLQESQKQLKQLSVTDELTGLRNRRYIMERLEDEFQRARRSGKPMGLIMLDLDFFKQINDMHGHQFGDLVLKAVASRMRSGIREYDLLGRVGGEEFFIVSPEAEVEETLRIAERIRELISGEAISDGKREVTVTISAGVTMLKEHDRDIDVLFSRADTALYSAKQQGRDRVVVL